jgi:predicted GH43/DUF377 family glycosyl hydrolase
VPKLSVFAQVQATAIAKNALKDSPRHWNNGLFRFQGRLWMCYRYHLMTSSGRCKTAICPIDDKTLQPAGPSQMLDLPETNGDEHMEDARLFEHQGQPYVSYTEMTGYQPGVDFKCVMKYARLSLRKTRAGEAWRVEETFLPKYGRNDWKSKEKNWVFFSVGPRLFCIYGDEPEHLVLELEGDRVVNEWKSPAPFWEWGVVRGGTPPALLADGNFLTVFHSSMPSEKPPTYVRYFAGAYVFRGQAPFDVLGISLKPLLSASEEDGHKVDPRYVEGWKPLVVFPCGLVQNRDSWLLSFGINDWQPAIARICSDRFVMASPDGTSRPSRYFRKANGSVPLGLFNPNRQSRMIHWKVPQAGAGCSAGPGYVKIESQREAEDIADQADVQEITRADYDRALLSRSSSSFVYG